MSARMYPLRIVLHLDVGAGTYYDPYNPTHLDTLIDWAIRPMNRRQPAKKIRRSDRPEEIRLPLGEITIGGYKLWRSSALFMAKDEAENIADDTRFYRKRFNSSAISNTSGNVNLRSGPFRDYNMPITILHISRLIAYAFGNRQALQRILRMVPGVGKKRHRGLGKIEDVQVERIRLDYSIMKNGRAMRWLPDRRGTRFVRLKPPYWNQVNVVQCCEVGANIAFRNINYTILPCSADNPNGLGIRMDIKDTAV